MALSILYVIALSPLFLLLVRTETPYCTFRTIDIPIKDVPLSNGAHVRGAAISVGSPPQTLSFQPVLQLNNTWIYDNGDDPCISGDTLAQCMTYAGGIFSPQDSSSYHGVGDYSTAGADSDSAVHTGVSWATEKLQLGSGLSLSQFPVAIAKDATLESFQSPLGLGANSTLLTRLLNSGTIGSRTWSLWWGLVGAEKRDQMDGGIVLGGYDAAKIFGEKNHTGTITPPGESCASGMRVNITELYMSFPDGSSYDLLVEEAQIPSLLACISPEYTHVMGLSIFPHFARFETESDSTRIGQSSGINYMSMQYSPDDVFQGDLVFGLDSGLQIRILNNQLVQPDAIANPETGLIERNTSVRNVLLWEFPYISGNTFLGRNFFTGAMIMVNRDDGTFTLWQANATTETNFTPVPEMSGEEDCVPDPRPQDPDDIGSDVNSHEGPILTPGKIAGIVIGIVIALLLAAVGILWCVKRYGRVTEVSEITPTKPKLSKAVHQDTPKEDPEQEQVESPSMYEASGQDIEVVYRASVRSTDGEEVDPTVWSTLATLASAGMHEMP